MRIGIIGTGGIAQAHGQAIQDSSSTTLHSVLSRNKTTGNQFSNTWSKGEAESFTNINDFLADSDLEMVLVASPDRLHYEQVKKSLNANKHVLCEKPFTATVDEGIELKKLAEEKNLKLGIGFHLRQHNGHKKLKKIIAQDNKKPRHIRTFWSWHAGDNSDWRAHSEVGKWWSLAGVGVHCIDIARWFVDNFEDWQKVTSLTSNALWNGPHDETALTVAQFKDGTTFEVTTSVQIQPYSRLELFYDDKTIVCHNTFGRHGGGDILIDNERLDFEIQNPFQNQIEYFIENDHLENNASVGVRSNKDLDAIVAKQC